MLWCGLGLGLADLVLRGVEAPVIIMSAQSSVPYDRVQEEPLTRSALLFAASLNSRAD